MHLSRHDCTCEQVKVTYQLPCDLHSVCALAWQQHVRRTTLLLLIFESWSVLSRALDWELLCAVTVTCSLCLSRRSYICLGKYRSLSGCWAQYLSIAQQHEDASQSKLVKARGLEEKSSGLQCGILGWWQILLVMPVLPFFSCGESYIRNQNLVAEIEPLLFFMNEHLPSAMGIAWF